MFVMSLDNERPDHERIFAWHILPLDKEMSGMEEEHLHILQRDKSAKFIIYCIPHFPSLRKSTGQPLMSPSRCVSIPTDFSPPRITIPTSLPSITVAGVSQVGNPVKRESSTIVSQSSN